MPRSEMPRASRESLRTASSSHSLNPGLHLSRTFVIGFRNQDPLPAQISNTKEQDHQVKPPPPRFDQPVTQIIAFSNITPFLQFPLLQLLYKPDTHPNYLHHALPRRSSLLRRRPRLPPNLRTRRSLLEPPKLRILRARNLRNLAPLRDRHERNKLRKSAPRKTSRHPR